MTADREINVGDEFKSGHQRRHFVIKWAVFCRANFQRIKLAIREGKTVDGTASYRCMVVGQQRDVCKLIMQSAGVIIVVSSN